jgi:hypothetical protein
MRLVKEKPSIYNKIPKLDVVGFDAHQPLQSLKILDSEELALKNTGGSVGKVIN